MSGLIFMNINDTEEFAEHILENNMYNNNPIVW
jgi:hypothetical protein